MYVYLLAAKMKHLFIPFLIWNILVYSRIVLGCGPIIIRFIVRFHPYITERRAILFLFGMTFPIRPANARPPFI